jgi:hypothetical protein
LTVAELTPSSFPDARIARPVGTDQVRIRYAAEPEVERYRIRLPAPAPREARVSLEFGKEASGIWAHIDELDVSAEGEDLRAAFSNVIAAANDWLSYIRDESPDLAPDLAAQERYVVLLDAPVFSWFREFRFVDE